MKKRIILIVLLVAAAFIAWKKGLFAKLTGSVETTAEASEAPADDSVDSIIERTSMTVQEKERCRRWASEIARMAKNGKWDIATSALKNGVTFNQEIVRAAVWQMCVTDSIFGKDYADTIMCEINQM